MHSLPVQFFHRNLTRLVCTVFALVLFTCFLRAGSSTPEAGTPEKTQSSVDLRPRLDKWGLTARNQGGRPTCSVFTFAGALEFATANAQGRGERLSVEYLNWAANQTRRNARDGGFFSEMWNGFAAHGISSENEMPYQSKFSPTNAPGAEVQTNAAAKLSLKLQLHWIKAWNVKTGLSEVEFARIKRTLATGWPVCAGMRWPKREVWKNDQLQMCPPEDVFDGHSVLLVGYRDDETQPDQGVFIFRNTNRGGRDGYLPYEYARRYINDALWIEGTPKTANAD
ncbi:MAG TPA: C1 family peptidase [Verrucomicrobiae bacterium]|nr:C1 family peptidase [Verrucomicrobiae bacterium]